jgi:hypothetical protein
MRRFSVKNSGGCCCSSQLLYGGCTTLFLSSSLDKTFTQEKRSPFLAQGIAAKLQAFFYFGYGV